LIGKNELSLARAPQGLPDGKQQPPDLKIPGPPPTTCLLTSRGLPGYRLRRSRLLREKNWAIQLDHDRKPLVSLRMVRELSDTKGIAMDLLPPNAEEIERLVDVRLASWQDGLKESVTVDWRDTRLPLPVISIPVELPYYNPHTRRIQAQKNVDEVRGRALDQDPFSDEAQGYLEELLQWDPANPGQVDPAFDKLMADLDEHGQNEPGLMTKSGVLINGNTRRAALKSLGKTNMLVGILPEDTSRADIDTLELSLQLRPTYKRDYSFVNELLAIDEVVRRGVSTPEVLKAFRMKQPRLDRSLWLLRFIDDAISRSRTVDASGHVASLRRFDFERDQGQLEELYRSWHTLNATDPDKATCLREARLIGVVLDFAKTDLRVMQEDFFGKYVSKKLPSSTVPKIEPQGATGIPGLPGVDLPGESTEVLQLRALADSVLQAQALQKQATLASPAAEETTQVLTVVRAAYEDARKLAGADADYRKKGTTPAERILTASDHVDFATAAVIDANAARSLDVGALEDSLEILRQSLTRFAQMLGRVEPTDDMDVGFTWIQAAVNASAHGSP
jgi:hypothetical protein